MHPYLFSGLINGPIILRDLIEALSPDQLDLRTHPERFTPREEIAHLADWEGVFLDRLNQMVNFDVPVITGEDEGERAIRFDYASQDAHANAEHYVQRRNQTVDLLKGLQPAQWNRQARHEEWGLYSIEQAANFHLGHDLYHIQHMVAMLKK